MSILYRYSHDAEAQTGYVTIGSGQVAETIDLGGNVLIDIDADGNAVGFELLAAPTEQIVRRWADALTRITPGGTR